MPYSAFDLRGKVALVTGGSRGIGWGIAEALAQAGANIAIWGRTAATLDVAVTKLNALGITARGYAIDVAQEEQVIEGMAATAKDFGRIDSVFANAAIAIKAPRFVDLPTEMFRELMSVNVDGAFFTLREACKHMVERSNAGDPGGSLVGVASLTALEGGARAQAYGASKGALISMIKSIAVEHARYGVRANSILPGFTETDMLRHGRFEGREQVLNEKLFPRIPARRLGQADDFGGVAVYLASNASSYHTGDIFIIDGGYAIF